MSERGGSMKLVSPLVVCACAVALLGLAGPVRAESKEASITAHDAIGRHGRPIKLVARLQRVGLLGINPDVSKEPLDFYLMAVDGQELPEARFVGSAETDADGWVKLEWKPEQPGRYDLEARIRKGSAYVAFPAPIHVAVPAPEQPVLLVFVDGTVSEATNLQLLRGKATGEIPAVEGASRVLTQLATTHQLLYLTDLESGFTGKFKEWLRARSMPVAPVLFWDFSRSLSHATYLQQRVEKLRQEVPQLRIGVGASFEDAQMFARHGLAGIALDRDADASDRPAEVLWAKSWDQVLQHVMVVRTSAVLLQELAGGDAQKSAEALHVLSLLGVDGLGYVDRFRSSSDPGLAAAATLIAARLRASEAFFAALERGSARAALGSLLAAWRQGDRAVVMRLYRDREAGLKAEIPRFRRVELVSTAEPEPGRVVFKLRLISDDGAPDEREVVFVQVEKTWLVDVQDF